MEHRLTPTKAIRAKCIDCCCGQAAEVRRCHIKRCPLWRFRMGREERDILYYSEGRGQKTQAGVGFFTKESTAEEE